MAKERGQEAQRMGAIFTDQHGREWDTWVEKATQHPCAPLAPHGWTPRTVYVGGKPMALVPPSHDEFGEPILSYPKGKLGQLRINYPAWQAQVERGHAEWRRRAQLYAEAKYGDKSAEAIQKPTPAMLDYLGPMPIPVEFVQAQAAGNKYMLGQHDVRPEWASGFAAWLDVPTHTVTSFPDADDARFADAPEPVLVGSGGRKK